MQIKRSETFNKNVTIFHSKLVLTKSIVSEYSFFHNYLPAYTCLNIKLDIHVTDNTLAVVYKYVNFFCRLYTKSSTSFRNTNMCILKKH